MTNNKAKQMNVRIAYFVGGAVLLGGCASLAPQTKLSPELEARAARLTFSQFVEQRLNEDENLRQYVSGHKVPRGSWEYRLGADLVYHTRTETITDILEKELGTLVSVYCAQNGGYRVTSIEVPQLDEGRYRGNTYSGDGCETPDGKRLVAAYHADNGYFRVFNGRRSMDVEENAYQAEKAAREAKRQAEREAREKRIVELRDKARIPSGKPLPVPIGILTNEFVQDFYAAGSRYHNELLRPGNESRTWIARKVWADLKFGYGAPGPEAAYVAAEVAFEK
jgi:hypothetical protein